MMYHPPVSVMRRFGRVINWTLIGPVLVVSGYVYTLLCCGCCGTVRNPVLYAIDDDAHGGGDTCETIAGGTVGAAIAGVTIMCCSPFTCCGGCGTVSPGEYVNDTPAQTVRTVSTKIVPV